MECDAASENAIIGNDEIFGHFRANYDQRVVTIATIDVYRSTFWSGNKISTLPTIDICEWCFWIVRVNQNEQANQEGVVIVITKQVEFCFIVVNSKDIVSDTTIDCGVLTDTVCQEASCCVQCFQVFI